MKLKNSLISFSKIILCAIFFSGCAFASPTTFQVALNNFTYKADIEDEWNAYDIYKPFSGDCEDFAFSLQLVIGGDVTYVFDKYDRPHAVLIKSGWIYDNQEKSPIPVDQYSGKIVNYIMVLK